jgi:hypothetical protein
LVLECLTITPRSEEIRVGDERSFAFRVGGHVNVLVGDGGFLEEVPRKNGVDRDEDNSELDRAGNC